MTPPTVRATALHRRDHRRTPSGPELRHWRLFALFTWLASGVLYLWLPPSPDQFNLSYMGWRLLSGDRPYVDFIDVNWPGVIGLHALATGMFGVHLWTWRALDFLLFGLSTLFLVDVVRSAAGQLAARACAIISPVLYVAVGYWMAGQPDMSAAQFLLVAMWCHLRGYEAASWRWNLWTGVAIGLAMLCKPTAGAILPLLAVQALWFGKPWREVLLHSLVAGLGLLGPLCAAVLILSAVGTPPSALFESTVTLVFAVQYVDEVMGKDRSLLVMLLDTHARKWADVTLAALPAVAWLFTQRKKSLAATVLPVLWLTGLISYFVQARGLPYHLAPCFVALIGLFAISTAVLVDGRFGLGQLRGIALPAAALVVIASQGYKLGLLYSGLPGAWLAGDASSHLTRFSAIDDITVDDAAKFARRVESDTSSNCVLVIGRVSAINYLSQRKQPTRFYYFPVIARAVPPLPMASHWGALWAADLRATDCRYLLVAARVRDGWLPSATPAAAALRELLQRYREAGVVGRRGGLIVYERQ